jgi:NADH:ubiquinone oxidoreductase subunit
MHIRLVDIRWPMGIFSGFFSLFGTLSPAHSGVARLLAGSRYRGTDSLGNKYYSAKARKGYRHDRRFVNYKGRPEASMVPPEWHGWLHHQTDIVPAATGPTYRQPWQKPSQPNLTGTDAAYRPPGHLALGGERAPASSDYEAWTPPA